MHYFPIKNLEWDEIEEDWIEGEEVIGYQAVAPDGTIIAKAETLAEVKESALISAFLSECNENIPRKIKLRRRMLNRKLLVKAK